MKLEYYIVDVFAEKQYQGNQLAVFLNTKGLEKHEMQAIALETNFAETTFIESSEKINGGYNVRIFTPDTEVPFAGHPTLGTAYIIAHFVEPGAKRITMNYSIGPVEVDLNQDSGILFMTQIQPTFLNKLSREKVAKILGLQIAEIKDDFPVQQVTTGLPFYIVPLKDLKAVRKISIDNSAYRELLTENAEQEITPAFLSFSTETYEEANNLNCRMHYMENNQIVEDSATGSANGCLLSYLLKTNFFNSTTLELRVEQGYEINRPSLIYHKGSVDNGLFKITIGGKVKEVSSGLWNHKR